MPTYDYKCPKCTNTCELKKEINDRYDYPLCNVCDVQMIMQISKQTGIHFKGNGFYETDYKGK